MEQIQVTLYNMTNKYKPVSAIVNVESKEWYLAHKKETREQGIIKICQKRYWTSKDLKKYEYSMCKMRIYDKQKIKQEKEERYEKIKKENGWA